MSREWEIRDMTHHAGAAHRRANTLEAREKRLPTQRASCVLHANPAKQSVPYRSASEQSDRGELRGATSHILTTDLSSPDPFALWWSGRVNCCWTPSEVAPCLSPPPALLFLSLVHWTRERGGRRAWRWPNLTERLQWARPPARHMTPWQKTSGRIHFHFSAKLIYDKKKMCKTSYLATFGHFNWFILLHMCDHTSCLWTVCGVSHFSFCWETCGGH